MSAEDLWELRMIVADLRHAYPKLVQHIPAKNAGIVSGLIAPQIRQLEAMIARAEAERNLDGSRK